MAASLVSIALLILLVVFCVKGLMCWASLVVLLQEAVLCLVIGLFIIFALPAQAQPFGPNLPYLPVSISALIVLVAAISLFLAQKNDNLASGRHPLAGSVVLVLGAALWLMGFISFCLFVFGGFPGSPDPQAAVVTFSVFTLAGSISMFIAAKCETARFPNLYRWLAFWSTIFILRFVFVASMILILAFPGPQPVTHPFWASITSLNYVPVLLLFIGLNKNYVKRKKAGPKTAGKEEPPDFGFEQTDD